METLEYQEICHVVTPSAKNVFSKQNNRNSHFAQYAELVFLNSSKQKSSPRTLSLQTMHLSNRNFLKNPISAPFTPRNQCAITVQPVSTQYVSNVSVIIVGMSSSVRKNLVIFSLFNLFLLAYILKENAEGIVHSLDILSQRTENFLKEGISLTKDMKIKKVKDMKQIDEKFEMIVKQIHFKKAQLKKQYNDAFNLELDRVNQEQENFEKHLSLISFSKDNVMKTVQELEQFQGKKIQGSDISNKLENFRKQEEEMREQTDKLSPIKISYPSCEFATTEFEKSLKQIASISHRTMMMTQKKICFFGDTNKVMTFDLQNERWLVKTLSKSNLEFLYYAAAVTLPNGDSLITGGGSSTTVYQYCNQKEELISRKSMNQMRKEHAAVINENLVYVMGGYDGVQNVFLNCCEIYNIQKNEWTYFAPMNISKCAFSATVVNKKFIYTFGGYDGQNRLDAIERYSLSDGSWELMKVKLKFALSNCACFCPEKSKVVLFGGGFSSGFSPYVEQIDVETQEWKPLPIMTEGRDLRNKVVFTDDNAYAVGGLNSKAEKFNYAKKQWVQLGDYPIIDNLDSWACALTFIPKEYPQAKAQISQSSGQSKSANEEEKELVDLLEQERLIDKEIQSELEKFRMERELGMDFTGSASEIRMALSESEENQEASSLVDTGNNQIQPAQSQSQTQRSQNNNSMQSASTASVQPKKGGGR